jgi:hypothetical protein
VAGSHECGNEPLGSGTIGLGSYNHKNTYLNYAVSYFSPICFKISITRT